MSEVKPDKTPSFLYDFGRFIPALDDIRVGMHELLNERDQLKAELAKLQSERETIDNGDGTVTAWKPVTYPKGCEIEGVRPPKAGETCYIDGQVRECPEDADKVCSRIILKPGSKPPEPVTWEAPLVDGMVTAVDGFVERDSGNCIWWTSILGLTKLDKLGRYQFKDGVGTMIEESK